MAIHGYKKNRDAARLLKNRSGVGFATLNDGKVDFGLGENENRLVVASTKRFSFSPKPKSILPSFSVAKPTPERFLVTEPHLCLF